MAQQRRIDPRGIMRKIVSVRDGTDAQLVAFDCGHAGQMAWQFTFKVGAECRCFRCGEEARAAQALETSN